MITTFLLNYKELSQLDLVSRAFHTIWIQLIHRTNGRIYYWPAIQKSTWVVDFVNRNARYAKPTNDPIYRE